jgi:hypothetical protein
MDVGMVLQGLSPSMQIHSHAELGAKMLGIGGNRGEGLGGGAEQNCIDDRLVLEGDLAGCRR